MLAASLTVVSLALLTGPGDGGLGETPPGAAHNIRPCAAGLVLHQAYPICRVVVHGPPLCEPGFLPAGTTIPWTNHAEADDVWVWEGSILGDPWQGHTVLELPQGTVIDLWLPLAFGMFGPYRAGYAVLEGDWNMDGAVNSRDISAFLRDWLTPPPQGWDGQMFRGDYDMDGLCTPADISAFLEGWVGSL